MISKLTGRLSAKGESTVLIEVGGVGFDVNVSENSPFFGESEGAELTIHTYLVVREDELSLYGFEDKLALSLFKKLIAISGVGPKAALAIISLGSAEDVTSAIAGGDSAYVSQAQGIGKKTAERVILELKDKLDALGGYVSSGPMPKTKEGARREAIDALIGLGYKEGEATKLVSEVKEEGLAAEEYIRLALKNA